MLELSNKVEKIKQYINDIINVIQVYNPNTVCISPKKLKFVADEMKEVILDNSQVEVNYMRDVADTEFYIAIQIPVITKTQVEFEVETSSRASITVSGSGTNIYDNGLKGTRRLTINVPNTAVNCEGWRPSNVVIRSNDVFTKFNIRNHNIIMIKGNMQGIQDLSYAFTGNRNLRVAELKNIESTNNEGMFYECNNLITAHLSFKEGIQYNATEMFSACRNMRYLSLDFSNITSARDMFYDCYSLEKIDIPKNSTIPNNLNLCDTAIQTKELIEFINNLKTIETKQTIYINETILKSFSEVQLNSFKNKGYILETIRYDEDL